MGAGERQEDASLNELFITLKETQFLGQMLYFVEGFNFKGFFLQNLHYHSDLYKNVVGAGERQEDASLNELFITLKETQFLGQMLYFVEGFNFKVPFKEIKCILLELKKIFKLTQHA